MLLQFMIPGGVELLVMLIVMLLMFGVPLLIVAGGGYLWFRSREDSKERVQRLEEEVAQLRAELREADVTDDVTDGTATEGTVADRVDSDDRTDSS